MIIQEELKSKAILYKLISVGFSFPFLELYYTIKQKEYLNEFKVALTSLELKMDRELFLNSKEVLTMDGNYFQDYEARYIMDFETNTPKSSCSLYERHYSESLSNAQLLLELKAFYKNFDLKKSSGFNDSEDHIVIELEFVHFLLFKELQAIEMEEDYKPYRKCRHDFIERHLLPWIPKLEQKMNENSVSDFHKFLISVLSSLVEKDYQSTTGELVAQN